MLPSWLELAVGVLEQLLVFPAVFAMFLVRSNPWWIVVVASVFLPRTLVQLVKPLELITAEREATARAKRNRLLQVFGILSIIALFVGLAAALIELLP